MSTTTLPAAHRAPAPPAAAAGPAPSAAARSKALLKWAVALTLAAVVVGIVLGARYLRANGRSIPENIPTFPVTRGPLTISVTQTGTVKAKEVQILKSELEGTATILFLVPEGKRVKKGELLVELDASKLSDTLLTQQITVQNAEAALVNARESLAVAQSQAKSDIAAAELAHQFAQEDLIKYEQGDFPTERTQAQSKIAVAREDLDRATEKLRWSRILFEEKYVSATELQADSLAYSKAKLELDLAIGALKLLEEFTYKRKVAELRSNVEQTAMALDRVKRKAMADVVQAEATLKAKESEYNRQKALLEKTQKMLANSKIYAPFDGVVIYATTAGGGGWRRDNEPIAEGVTVRERQEIIHLPTANQMMAEVKVHESALSKVRVGQPVRVTVDAVPGAEFWGRVAKIGQMPDSQDRWMNPDLKVYATEIHLDAETDALRTGMTCRAEIIVEQHADALYVPVQSVVRPQGEPVVYVVKGGKTVERPVTIGLDNNSMVHILSGLSEGELVMLNPPLGEGRPAKANDVPPPPPPSSSTTRPVAAMPAAAGLDAGPDGASANSAGGPATRPSREGAAGRREGRGAGGTRNMTPEQQEALRKRLEAMTPEQRQQYFETMRRQREQRGGDGSNGSNGERGGGNNGGGDTERGGGDR